LEPSNNPTQSEEPSGNPTQSEEPSDIPTQTEEPSELPILTEGRTDGTDELTDEEIDFLADLPTFSEVIDTIKEEPTPNDTLSSRLEGEGFNPNTTKDKFKENGFNPNASKDKGKKNP